MALYIVSIDWLTGWLALCDMIEPGWIRNCAGWLAIVFAWVMRLADLVLLASIALGDSLKL